MKMYRPHRLCPRNSKPKEPSLYRSLCVSILCMFLSTVMLVGTTFAWFHSSATSAVSTITAGGLNVSTSYITQNTVRAHADIGSDGTVTYRDITPTEWIPFDGNGGNPFGSIPFNSNSAQVIFLKLTNNSNSHVTYRLALNLLGDTSVSANSGNSLSSLLRYGCSVLDPVPTNSSESSLLATATIPGATTTNGITTYSADVTSLSSENFEISGTFVDALSSHSSTTIERDDNNEVTRITYGGHICKVDLGANETKYIAVSLYMPNGSSYGESTALVYIQLSMTVNQLHAENPLMPNVVGSTAVTQQELDAAFSLMYESFLNEDELLVVGETKSPEDNTVTNTETPAETGDATDQPTTGSGTTDTEKTQTSTETSTGSTTGTENATETPESGNGGNPEPPAAESESAPNPTT